MSEPNVAGSKSDPSSTFSRIREERFGKDFNSVTRNDFVRRVLVEVGKSTVVLVRYISRTRLVTPSPNAIMSVRNPNSDLDLNETPGI